MRLFALTVVLAVACTPTPPPLPAPQPVVCPKAPAPECPKQRTKIVKVKQDCPHATPARSTPRKTAALTCVLGHVKTAGDMRMVVQRAMVVVWHGDRVLAETWTDDLGSFAACVNSSDLAKKPLDVAIEISKEPFNPVMLKTRLTQGQHREFQVGFEAEGLTN
jgi:hypothetical protein